MPKANHAALVRAQNKARPCQSPLNESKVKESGFGWLTVSQCVLCLGFLPPLLKVCLKVPGTFLLHMEGGSHKVRGRQGRLGKGQSD